MTMTAEGIAKHLPTSYTEFGFNYNDNADSVSYSKVVIIYLNNELTKLQIATVLEQKLGYPRSEIMGGYAELNPRNRYRFNLTTSKPVSISGSKTIADELSRVLSSQYSTLNRVVVIDYKNTDKDVNIVFDTTDENTMLLIFDKIKNEKAKAEKLIKDKKESDDLLRFFDGLSLSDKKKIILKIMN